ncbi:MAG: DNA repair protein RecN [Candidatus Omnitrophica bacterium]|nr:DNA repair protein RecN [Candidatus Omnitrophota bacterium]
MTIKNFGIIEHASLECSQGLNILTGETGAGKSILIDALRFALGERFQSTHMRDGTDQCLVEAIFLISPKLAKTLPSLEDFPCEDERLIIQRSVSSDGKNRIKINGLTATVAQLKELGDHLIDFHGPHDHQLLLAEHRHINILDALTDFGKIKSEYQVIFKEYGEIQKKINTLHALALSRERDLNLLGHQIKELEQVPLDNESLESVEQDRIKINNSEKLFENISQALAALENDDVNIETILSRANKSLQNLADIDPNASVHLDQLAELQDSFRILISALHDYASSLSFDPDRAKEVNEQSDFYHDIKRKYGPTIEKAKEFYDEAKKKYDLLSDFEHNESSLKKDLDMKEKELRALASDISLKRKKSSSLLKKTIEGELHELGFKTVVFEVKIEKSDFTLDGHDKISFQISPNTGESLKPLAEIVSSGESARIMLAIKKALMKVDLVPVLIFDEIDAQIGGRLGTVIGTKLKEISSHRQVILITHLPQIAAFADIHFRITKRVEDGRTKTQVHPLNDQHAKIEELAHMMTGDKITDIARQHAKDMLSQTKKNKQ